MKEGTDYYNKKGGFSMFPAIGSLLNQKVFFDNKTIFALIGVNKTPVDNKVTVKCLKVKGKLEKPTSLSVPLLPQIGEYIVQAGQLMPQILLDEETVVQYYFGRDCSAAGNVATYNYRLSETNKPKVTYLNNINMTRTLEGQPKEEDVLTYMNAAPQNVPLIGKGRFLIAGVSFGKPQTDSGCKFIELTVTANDVFYADAIAKYVEQYFGPTFSDTEGAAVDDIKGFVTKCIADANACNAARG